MINIKTPRHFILENNKYKTIQWNIISFEVATVKYEVLYPSTNYYYNLQNKITIKKDTNLFIMIFLKGVLFKIIE
jgi:hypothetical protein